MRIYLYNMGESGIECHGLAVQTNCWTVSGNQARELVKEVTKNFSKTKARNQTL